MKRWNGWGDDAIQFELGADALAFLRERIGPGAAPADASFEQACAAVAPSRLAPHRLVDTGAAARACCTRYGQSLPDWLRLRYGQIGPAPDGVAWPESGARGARAARLCAPRRRHRDSLRRRHQRGRAPDACPKARAPVLCLDTYPAARDDATLTASAAGHASAPACSAPTSKRSCAPTATRSGHFPQSFEYSSLGGWVVTRSSGQQSLRYGRIEQMFAGGRLETPAGTLDIPTFPASAAGTDLREMVLGSEGRIGVLTEATVRVTQLPAHEAFHAVFLPAAGTRRCDAVRALAQARLPLSMLRLSNPLETLDHAGAGRAQEAGRGARSAICAGAAAAMANAC